MNKSQEPQTKFLSAQVPGWLERALRVRAAEMGITKSEAIRQACLNWLSQVYGQDVDLGGRLEAYVKRN